MQVRFTGYEAHKPYFRFLPESLQAMSECSCLPPEIAAWWSNQQELPQGGSTGSSKIGNTALLALWLLQHHEQCGPFCPSLPHSPAPRTPWSVLSASTPRILAHAREMHSRSAAGHHALLRGLIDTSAVIENSKHHADSVVGCFEMVCQHLRASRQYVKDRQASNTGCNGSRFCLALIQFN